MNKKIFAKTFGCQMNEYDTNRIIDTVKKIGFTKTENLDDTDCFLLNTCHIRDKAKEKVYHEIGRVKKRFRLKKKPFVIVAGCVAQAENEEMLKREPFIDLVIGPQAYHKINDKIEEYLNNQRRLDETDFDAVSKFNYLDKIKNSSKKISSFFIKLSVIFMLSDVIFVKGNPPVILQLIFEILNPAISSAFSTALEIALDNLCKSITSPLFKPIEICCPNPNTLI